jgi:hypothetical protein
MFGSREAVRKVLIAWFEKNDEKPLLRVLDRLLTAKQLRGGLDQGYAEFQAKARAWYERQQTH